MRIPLFVLPIFLFELSIAAGAGAQAVPAPDSVAATETAPGEITVTWTEVPGAKDYQLFKATWPNGARSLGVITGTRYVDRAVKAAGRYSYHVGGRGATGNPGRRTKSNDIIAGSGSAVATSTTTGTEGSPTGSVANPQITTPLPDLDKDSQKSLAPPQKLWAAQTSPNEVTLTWQPQTGIREFRILVAINQLAPVLLGSVGGSGSRYVARITDTGAQLMTFFIQAIAQDGGASEKAVFNAITPDLPKAPSNAKATLKGSTVELTWTVVPGASQYMITRAGRVAATVAGTVSWWAESIQGLAGAIQYQIVAVNAKGRSSPMRFNTIDLSKGAR